MSLVERAITVVITAGPNSKTTFGPQKQNTLTLAGYKVSCQIEWPGGISPPSAAISIYGMNESDMNALASLGQLLYSSNLNEVSILAGDNENGMSLAFQGTLQNAFVNLSDAPQVSFDMTAQVSYNIAMTPVPVSSYAGAADVATIMSNIALAAGWAFENNGVNAVLSNPYFPGTYTQQIQACARAANINAYIDPISGGANGATLAIWPKYGHRGAAAVPVSAKTGMVGYPRYTANGIDVDMLFNPNLLFAGQIQVTSILQPACGTWNIYSLSHSIESITENGDWMTTASCWNPANFAGMT